MAQEPTAAQRVFAIPELLEHILLDAAVQVIHDPAKLEPAATISRCQSVNRNFHATITQSTKIQRRLQYGGPNCENLDPYRVLHWLFTTKLNLDLDRAWCESDSGQYLELWPKYLQQERATVLRCTPVLEIFRGRHSSPGATWRHVKLQGSESYRIEIRLCYVASKYNENGCAEWEDLSHHTLRFAPKDTLGTVFDSYCAILDEAMAERMEVAVKESKAPETELA